MTYEPWKAAQADADEAKAESLEMAAAQLRTVIDAVDFLGRSSIAIAITVLEVDAQKYREKAKLAAV